MVSPHEQLEELRQHQVPDWWRDAKLGIFIHWTPASVPAFAPVHGNYGDLLMSRRPDAFASSPYVEWYENSLRFPNSPASVHHRSVWGDRPYRSFAADFELGLEHWDPDAWAAAFAASGAQYVVLVAKHMDGWCLWPTSVTNPVVPNWHSRRDIVGELGEAVRARGLRFGLYYCGGLDSTFLDVPMGSMGGVIAGIPRGQYPAYAEAHVRELIDRYRPSILWNDVAWPGDARSLWPLLANYYRTVPDGIVNDRWMPWNPVLGLARRTLGRRLIDAATRRQTKSVGGLVPPKPPHFDYRTPEYMTFDDIQSGPWECVRGMDQSFGYNAESGPDDFIARTDLLWMLTDIVAKGGNLLLNVGPRGTDAQIPPPQLERLTWLASITTAEGPLRGTRPFDAPGTSTLEGDRVRYTTRGGDVFALTDSRAPSVTLVDIETTSRTVVSTLSHEPLTWRRVSGGLNVELPSPPNLDIRAFTLRGVTHREHRSASSAESTVTPTSP